MQFHLNGFEPGDPDIVDRSERYPSSGAQGPAPEEVDVLIVGCGPAGLTLAAQLSAFPDIKTCIVEQKPGRMLLGQADGIACHTMEMFHAFGFSERVLNASPTTFNVAGPRVMQAMCSSPPNSSGRTRWLNLGFILRSPAVHSAAAGRRVIASVGFHFAALAVHVAWPRPIGQRVMRAGFVAARRHGVENAVDAEHLFAAARAA
jgi:hypothetical protein